MDGEHTRSEKLHALASALLKDGRGILAADESAKTMDKRFVAVGAETTSEMRRTYREMLFTSPGIEEYLSGVILYDATIRGATEEGVPFADLLTSRGIMPGIKVDMGAIPFDEFPGEVVTEGLDGLSTRLREYYDMGARFTKWRAVITIGEQIPTQQCISMNAVMLARFAALSQAAGMVPMVEPEVLHQGNHSLEQAQQVTEMTLRTLFATLTDCRIDLKGLILKSSMVLPGDASGETASPEEVADATLRTFRKVVPEAVAGIAFLSGGQTPKMATENLQAIAQQGPQPWKITFSYSRALEEPVLAVWKGDQANAPQAQTALLKRLELNAYAQRGTYDPKSEGV